MDFEKKYLNEVINATSALNSISGRVAWRSPSNIALIKYWGKHGEKYPMNPSVSLTLNESATTMRVNYQFHKRADSLRLRYNFSGTSKKSFATRIESYLLTLNRFLPFINYMEFEIFSENTFPHSAGIASSASAFSALALCLAEIEAIIKDQRKYNDEFFTKASFLARLGSGSACRSVFGGVVLWGNTNGISGSSDEVALSIDSLVHPVIRSLRNVILIIDNSEKSLSSSEGHALMKNNPFAKIRFKQARVNLNRLLTIISEGSMIEFFDLIEYEALTLHAMMMTTYPGYVLMKPLTLEIIEKIREQRKKGVEMGFTIDAGANVHLLYTQKFEKEVTRFIQDEIESGIELYRISDHVGNGPVKLSE